MSSYGGKELASAFRTVRKNTIQVAEDIPESQYAHVAAPGCKSVAEMLAHIAVSTQIWEEIHKKLRMTTLAGLDYLGIHGRIDADEAKHRSKAEIIERLRTSGEEFAAWLETLTPEFLAEMVTEHRAVVAAVADGDAERAEETLRHHLRMVLSSLPHIRAAHPDYFEES